MLVHLFQSRHPREGGDPLPANNVCGTLWTMKDGGWVYILASGKMGTLYVGSTSDLLTRITEHKNKTFKGFTEQYDVDKLVYYEWHDSLVGMVKRERQIKKWNRNWKLRRIVDMNPNWRDLYNDVLIANGFAPLPD